MKPGGSDFVWSSQFFVIQSAVAGLCPLLCIRHILALRGPQLWSTPLFLDVELFKVHVLDSFTVMLLMLVTAVAHNLIPVRNFLIRVPRVSIFRVTILLDLPFVGVVVFPLFTPLEISGHPFGRVVGAHVHCVVWVQAGPHFVYVVVVSGVIVAYLDAGFLEALVRVARVGCVASRE